MENARAFPSASVSGGSTQVISANWPALNTNPEWFCEFKRHCALCDFAPAIQGQNLGGRVCCGRHSCLLVSRFGPALRLKSSVASTLLNDPASAATLSACSFLSPCRDRDPDL